jgi:hypothetical protein
MASSRVQEQATTAPRRLMYQSKAAIITSTFVACGGRGDTTHVSLKDS